MTGGKAVGDKGMLSLELFNLELELALLLPVAAVSLDFGIQSPVIELLGVGHQVMVPFGGANKKPVVPDWHGLYQLVNDLSGGGIKGGDVHILIRVTPCQKVSLAIIATMHPLGLHLEAISDRDEGHDFALIGFEIIGVHGFVLLLILSKAGADFVKTFFSGVKPPLEVLDLLDVIFVAFVKGLEEAVNKAPQVFRSHFKNSQRSGCGSWREGECEGSCILDFLGRWWYGQGHNGGGRGFN